MPRAKQNQLLQFITPFVDKTDGLSIESGVTSNFTQRLWGVRHGTSAAATAKTPSKTLSVVRSGLFRVTLKSTEVSDFDEIIWNGTHASCADQNWAWTLYGNDDSDVHSALTVIQSMASDAASAAQQANSRVLLNLSRISDIASYLVAMSSLDSDVYSLLSDLQSDFQSRVPKRVATDSQLSDLHSDLRSYMVGISDMLSNVQSELSDTHSDLASKIAGVVATLSVSDISDIASAVWAHTIGARVDSRVLINLSRISDVYSLLSDTGSDLRSLLTTTGIELGASTLSDIRSAIAAGPAATVTASDISDIASAVWAHIVGTRVDSRILVNQSRVSDVYSLLSDTNSDLRSLIEAGGGTVTVSNISDIASAVQALLASVLSDTLSAAQQANSRVLLNQSRVSDVYSLLSDLQSDFQSRVPKAVATNSQLSDLHSDLRSFLVGLSSTTSDIYSLLSDTNSDLRSLLTTTGIELGASTMSDLRSAITAGGAALTTSNISDIASAVQALLASTLSDTLSAAQQTNSRALVIQSQTSDIYSLLSDVSSDLGVMSGIQSDIYSMLTDISSVGSNIYSMLSDMMSDFQSRVPGRLTPAASALAELAADPGANPTLAQAVMTVFMWLHNNGKTTSSKRLLRNFAGTTVLSATISDDGTSFLQGKLG